VSAAGDLPVFFEHQRDPESTRMAGLVSRDDAAFREHWKKILEEFPRRPLHAVVARHNRASLRVVEKSGFSIVGEGRGSAGGRGPVLDEYTLELDGTE
jgi:L-amino acid N-acyltransferase YncA